VLRPWVAEGGQGKHMLDAYIIDAIRQQEEKRRQAEESRRIYLDLPPPPPPPREQNPDMPDSDQDRGPIIIPLYRDDHDGEEEDAA
jgi:hypothetical protein